MLRRQFATSDLMDPESIINVLQPGDTVLNLAYIHEPIDDNLLMTQNLVVACKQKNVARLIHCSTAVVVGSNSSRVIDESALNYPKSDYEIIKLKIESIIKNSCDEDFDVGILRPTAILGASGRNLVKLADSLMKGSAFVNYIKASLYGSRNMHLIPVKMVVQALLYLALQPNRLDGNVFIASADSRNENKFC